MGYEITLGKGQMKRTPKGEKLISFEGFTYGVEVRVETCNTHWLRVIVLEDGLLVLTRRIAIVGTQKDAVKQALEIGQNYYCNEQGRLALANQQQPLFAEAS